MYLLVRIIWQNVYGFGLSMICLSTSLSPFSFEKLEKVDTIKDLGLTFDTNLKFREHIIDNWLIDWLTALRHISTERLLVPRNVAKQDKIKISR